MPGVQLPTRLPEPCSLLEEPRRCVICRVTNYQGREESESSSSTDLCVNHHREKAARKWIMSCGATQKRAKGQAPDLLNTGQCPMGTVTVL